MKYEMERRHITPQPPLKKRRPKIIPPPPSYKPAKRSANFILVKLAPDIAEKTLKELRKIKGISGFHPVYGEYDLVIIVREKNGFDKKSVVNSIWGIPGVVEVQTLVAAS